MGPAPTSFGPQRRRAKTPFVVAVDVGHGKRCAPWTLFRLTRDCMVRSSHSTHPLRFMKPRPAWSSRLRHMAAGEILECLSFRCPVAQDRRPCLRGALRSGDPRRHRRAAEGTRLLLGPVLNVSPIRHSREASTAVKGNHGHDSDRRRQRRHGEDGTGTDARTRLRAQYRDHGETTRPGGKKRNATETP